LAQRAVNCLCRDEETGVELYYNNKTDKYFTVDDSWNVVNITKEEANAAYDQRPA